MFPMMYTVVVHMLYSCWVSWYNILMYVYRVSFPPAMLGNCGCNSYFAAVPLHSTASQHSFIVHLWSKSTLNYVLIKSKREEFSSNHDHSIQRIHKGCSCCVINLLTIIRRTLCKQSCSLIYNECWERIN